ncbi:DnaT-like ssDNA-binding domain-containing protein [Morganella morganii]|uniref:DnaT-like ssDNA-binding domain-containing protein n=1 Tax=Morganella morganii TaxID=582 RepID=UPI001BD31075|nr:DnaT-like ssDNA-binding domain-containing protein [Morganella morganii]
MRDYGKVSPQFWIGKTGKEIREKGHEALIVSMYLLTNPHANMTGMYYLPVIYMAHETGLGLEGASKGLRRCIEAGFCHYDEDAEVVWVIEMAKYQIAPALKASDNRCIGIQREYDSQPKNQFLSMFYQKYKDCFHMSSERKPSEKKERGFEGASETLGSQEQDQEQEHKTTLSGAREENFIPVPEAEGSPAGNWSDYPGKFVMTGHWQPDQDFSRKAAQWGVILNEPYRPEELAEFITYWQAEGKAKHHAQWEMTFAKSIRQQRMKQPKQSGGHTDDTEFKFNPSSGKSRAVQLVEHGIRKKYGQEYLDSLAEDDRAVWGQVDGQERDGTVIDVAAGNRRIE